MLLLCEGEKKFNSIPPVHPTNPNFYLYQIQCQINEKLCKQDCYVLCSPKLGAASTELFKKIIEVIEVGNVIKVLEVLDYIIVQTHWDQNQDCHTN